MNKTDTFTSETVFNIIVKLLKQIAISMGNHNCYHFFCKKWNKECVPLGMIMTLSTITVRYTGNRKKFH